MILIIGIAGLTGCGAKGKGNERNPTEDRLYMIGKAYLTSCYRLGHAPKEFAEIKPFLEGEVPTDLLVSPRDGEKFVILWGTDFTKVPPAKHDPFTVGGYEKKGVDGTRYVLRFPIGIVTMTDEAFQKAVFPPGHKAPS